MATFNSGNPAFKDSIYEGTIFEGMEIDRSNTMNLKGTLNKFGFLLLMMAASAVFSWKYAETGRNILPLLLVGAFGGLILAIIMARKPQISNWLSPAYALLQGLFVGAISAYFENGRMAAGGYSGIVFQAVGLTLLVAAVMLCLFRFRIIKVTEKLRSIVLVATIAVGIFYLATWGLSAFGIYIPFLYQNTWLGIGFSVLMVGLAAFRLLVNFDDVEKAIDMGAPKYMEWYTAFGLVVTLVWLYLEILRLLAKLNRD